MSDSPRRRGRPRSTDADAAILDATRRVLAEVGWDGLTMAEVAARAGVAKTTLYRRWPSKHELVVDAVAALFAGLALPDLGSLRADLEEVVARFAALLARPEAQASLYALFAEGTRDATLRARIREAVIAPMKSLVHQGRAAAQERGELPPDGSRAAAAAEADLIYDAIAGTVEHRVLVTGEPADPAWIRRFTSLLLLPLGAG
ncbi:TetR/AcrR family transcriptional regulator [Phaeacidiphilus oryzae]|jgi:AcrR family transcriptional regulator|uniref:TetR/AcrR family transcriptional regulator n=1 Tax=Phaeacidiphilus oryzae TaxID=348818 RepID=UPI0005640029|nr:TetR/AcrR family transcriptional regulator [Phaeacidiphilus oryzae]